MKNNRKSLKRYFQIFILYTGKRKRLTIGIVMLAVSLIAAAALFVGEKRGPAPHQANRRSDKSIIATIKEAKAKNPKLYENMEVRETGPCKNAFEVTQLEGRMPKNSPPLCTGYDDQVARLDDPVQVYHGLIQKPVECIGDGTSGRRVQAVYAYTTGQENKLAKDRTQFDTYAERVNSIFNSATSKLGYTATVRWVTTADCKVDIATIELPVGASGFYGMIDEIYRQIGIRADRNYLVWVDGSLAGCGLGSWRDDTRADPAININNLYGGFARVDRGCWGGHTETHELLHTFGAVSKAAPNSDGSGHCTDEVDVMCYGPNMRMVCQLEAKNNQIVDCNNDDYFHPNPAAGSFLATHWNTARSTALQITPKKDMTPPAAPTGIRLSRKVFNIYLNWDQSIDTESGISHYRIYRFNTTDKTYAMSSFTFLANTQNNYYNLWDSESYYSQKRYTNYFYIVAVDKEGNVSQPSVVASIGPPDPWPTVNDNTSSAPAPPIVHTPLPDPVVVAPTIVNLRSSEITQSSFMLEWAYSGDETQVQSVEVYLNGALYAGGLRLQGPKHWFTGMSGGIYQVSLKLHRTNGEVSTAGPITVTTSNYFDPSVVANHKPYDLKVIRKDATRYYISATFNTTSSPAYKHTLNINGSSSGAQWYLSQLNYPHTVEFYTPITATPTTSFSISVYDEANNLLIQSDTIPNSLL